LSRAERLSTLSINDPEHEKTVKQELRTPLMQRNVATAQNHPALRDFGTGEGIVYPPGWEIPLAVWLWLPVRERNTLLNTAKVEQCDE
jgi:hypothetical protein